MCVAQVWNTSAEVAVLVASWSEELRVAPSGLRRPACPFRSSCYPHHLRSPRNSADYTHH